MTDSVELREVERLIQVVEDNLRQLQEEATAVSGAADEERIANRIADQEQIRGQTNSSAVADMVYECNYPRAMRTHEWGPVGEVGQLTPGTLFYVLLDGATHLAMKVEVAGDHQELVYYCAILSPRWDGKNAPPCLVHEKTISSVPVLVLPNAVLLPLKPWPNENSPTAGQLVKTTDGLVLTVTDIRGTGYTSFLVETGEVLKSRPQDGFVYFQSWKIALPSPLRSGRWHVILEWPARGGDTGLAGA